MVKTTRLRLDRISSSTRNAQLTPEVIVGDEIVAVEGYVLAVRILARQVQLQHGGGPDRPDGVAPRGRCPGGYPRRPAGAPRICRGGARPDRRWATRSRCSTSVESWDAAPRPIPRSARRSGPKYWVPCSVSPTSAIGSGARRISRITRCLPADRLESQVPVVYVAGTCMNAGKTVAATELVRGLTRSGLRVAAAKLTGVSLMRDALSMQDAGAIAALTFNDIGIATTRAGITVPAAKGILNRLAGSKPDVIVAELGDGILGDYGVQDILRDRELMAVGVAYVMAAPDPVGCWGAVTLMRDLFGLEVSVLTGPATDNEVGRDYVKAQLSLPAHNALRDAGNLVGIVRSGIETRQASSMGGQLAAVNA